MHFTGTGGGSDWDYRKSTYYPFCDTFDQIQHYQETTPPTTTTSFATDDTLNPISPYHDYDFDYTPFL